MSNYLYFTDYEPCQYCEDGWLPVDGERDSVDDLLYLIPTQMTPCICNPLWSINDDLEADPANAIPTMIGEGVYT